MTTGDRFAHRLSSRAATMSAVVALTLTFGYAWEHRDAGQVDVALAGELREFIHTDWNAARRSIFTSDVIPRRLHALRMGASSLAIASLTTVRTSTRRFTISVREEDAASGEALARRWVDEVNLLYRRFSRLQERWGATSPAASRGGQIDLETTGSRLAPERRLPDGDLALPEPYVTVTDHIPSRSSLVVWLVLGVGGASLMFAIPTGRRASSQT